MVKNRSPLGFCSAERSPRGTKTITGGYRYALGDGTSRPMPKSWQCAIHGGERSTGGRHGMTSNWAPTHLSWGPDSGRILDTARGILIGVRRCPSESAFDELHSAAQRHRVPVFAMAWALVHLAGERH